LHGTRNQEILYYGHIRQRNVHAYNTIKGV
jgi:hypothetical protein